MSGSHARPVWDRGEPIDPLMMRFTIGDDWLQDRRLVEVDIRGSLAHAAGLERAGLIPTEDARAIRNGLEALLAAHRAGGWDVDEGDEDVHSAVERRLVDAIGDAGKRLHTGRSRNDQVAVDLRLWLREAVACVDGRLGELATACRALAERAGELPLPGYTHLRRAMPSSVADWAAAHARAFELDRMPWPRRACASPSAPWARGPATACPWPSSAPSWPRPWASSGPRSPSR